MLAKAGATRQTAPFRLALLGVRYPPPMLFADRTLAGRVEAAECRLSLAIVDAVVARGSDAFSLPVNGGAAVFSGAGITDQQSDRHRLRQWVLGNGVGGGGAPVRRRGCPVRVELSTLADLSIASGLSRRGYLLTEFENVLGFSLADATEPAAAHGRELTIATHEGDLSTSIESHRRGLRAPGWRRAIQRVVARRHARAGVP